MSEDLVALVLPYACVVVDYRTGRTQLRPVLPKGQHLPKGAVVVEHLAEAPSWGTIESAAALTRAPGAPWTWRLAALPVLLVTAVVGTVGPRAGRFRRLVRLGCIGRTLRPAAPQQAQAAVRAVRWASRIVPARWACLEQSAASALLLALARVRGEWRHGVAGDPVRLHAWIVDRQGRPVEEPPDTALYAVMYTPDGPGPVRQGPRRRTT